VRLPSGVLGLTAAILAVGVIGAAIDAIADDVTQGGQVDVGPDRFESMTRLCPPATGASGALWVTSGEEPARVALEPQDREATPLAERSLLRTAAQPNAVDVVGYDATVSASATFAFEGEGAGATACGAEPSEQWFFGQGSTSNEFDQRIVLYNPFPEEASVRINLYTDEGRRSPASLTDIAVSANGRKIVSFLEDTDPTLGRVGAEVVASRGRIVAWRETIVTADELPNGTEFSLGATAPATRWYFPTGAWGAETVTNINVLNPSDAEASLKVQLATEDEILPSLEQVVIPPDSTGLLDLERVFRGDNIPPSFSVTITSTVPVVAERTIGSTGEQPGRSSEVGAAGPALEWTLAPVGVGSTADRLTVLNPNKQGVELQVTLVRAEGPPLQPDGLQQKVRGGRILTLPLERWRDEGPFTAVVSGDGEIVAERSAQYRNDRSTAIGVPSEG
jgi:hypothetical protein